MLLDTPCAGLISEAGEDQVRFLEGAVAVAKRGPHPVISEGDNVCTAIAGEVGEEARMLLDTPYPGLITETFVDEVWVLKGAVVVAERGPHPVISKDDNARTAIAPQVGEEVRMLLDTPFLGRAVEPAVIPTEC